MPKASWFRRLVRFFAAEQSTAADRSRDEAFPRLYPTRLEDRQVLDGVPLIQLDPQGMVTVTAGADANDGRADSFEATRIETDGESFLQIKVNDRTAAEYRLNDVKQLRFEGSQDADTLTLDASVVPIGGVEFVGNAIPAPVGAPTSAGVDRLVLQGSLPAAPGTSGAPGTPGAPGGSLSGSPLAGTSTSGAPGTGTSASHDSLIYQIDTTSARLSTADGAWRVTAHDVERIVDPLSVDGRQVFVGAGLDATLRGGDAPGGGWTTIETVTGPTVELRNSLASLAVTATNVRVTGRVETIGADLTLSAVQALTVTETGELASGGGTIQLNAPQVLVQGVVDVGPSGVLRIDVGSTGLLTVGGTLRAAGDSAGSHGGRIELRGDFVHLLSTARIDATGAAGGGQVLLGSSGDTTADPLVGSRGLWIELGATVDASATQNGDGGRIIAWGTEALVVDGLLSATGGALGGDGGFVDTSTRGRFSLTAAPILTAPHGHGGEWLIDPDDLEIVSGAGSAGFNATGPASTPVFTSSSTHSQLSVTTLLAAMGNGVTVELKTGNGAGGLGNITLNADIDYNGKGTGTLKFTAAHSIILNNQIYDSNTATTDKLTLILAAGGDGLGTSSTQLNADVATNGGAFVATGDDFTQAPGRSLTTAGGTISVTTTAGKSIVFGGSVNSGAGTISLTGDDISFGGPANSIVGTGPIVLQQLTPSVQIGLGGATGAFSLSTNDLNALADGFSQITIGRSNGTGGINMNATTFRDPIRLQSPTGGTINVDGTLTGTGNASIVIDGSGTTTVLSANIITAGTTVTFSDNVQVDAPVLIDTTNGGAVPAGANVTFQGTLDATAAVTPESLTITTGTAGDVAFVGAVGATQRLDSLSVTGDAVSFSSSAATSGALTVVSAGATSFTGPVSTTAAGGNITLTNAGLLTLPVGATVTSAGTFTQNGAGAVTLGANVSTASGAVSFSGPVTITAAVTINSATSGTGANVTFSNVVNATAAVTPESLTVTAGATGDVTFTGAVGATHRLDSLNVTGDVVLFSSSVATTGALTVASAGTMTFTGPVSTTAAGGNITLTNTGLLTIPVGANISSAGTFVQNGTGAVSLGGNVSTASGAISFASPVTVTAAAVINSATSGTGGNVTFSNTVNATAAVTPESLTVTAGPAGDVTFTGAVGSTQPLDFLHVTGDVVLFSAAVAVTGAITVISTGTQTFNGTVTTTAATGDITLTNGGTLTIAPGATFTSGGTFTQNGAGGVTLGDDVVTAGGAISFASPIKITQSVLVDSTSGAPAGANVTFSGTIDATVAVTPEALTVRAGTTGDVTFSAAIGSTQPLDFLDVSGDVVSFGATVELDGPLTVVSVGTLDFAAAVTASTAGGFILLTNGGLLTIAPGATMSSVGTFTQNGAGNVSLGDDVLTDDSTISFATQVTLTDAVQLSSTAGGGAGADITLAGDVLGTTAAESLTLDAGTAGDISAQALGVGAGVQRLGGLVITSADDVTATSIATAGGMTSTSNTLSVSGAVDSSGGPVSITVNHSGPGPALQLDAVNVHGENLTISSAGEVRFLGGPESIESTGPAGGTFTLQGTAVGTTIGLGTGAAGALQLDDASVDAIGPGFTGGIVFGRSAQTGTITLRGPNHSYDQNVTIRATGGANVDVGASLDTIEGGAVGKTITISGATGTSLILLGGDLITDGGKVQIVGDSLRVIGPGVRSIVTSGPGGTAANAGDVELDALARILGDGASGLAIDSRWHSTNDASANDGQVDLPAAIGSATLADSLTRLDVRTDRGTTVLDNSGGFTKYLINGTPGTTSLFLNGPVYLTGDTTMTVTPGDFDASEATFSTSSGLAKSLVISTVDGGGGADGVARVGEMDAAGGLRVRNVTITTSDGGPSGALVFDHPGATLDIDIVGAFTHTGQRVIVTDSLNLTTNGGNITLAGDIDASSVGVAMSLDASGLLVGGTVDPGPIGQFGAFGPYGGGFHLSEVRLTTNHNGSVRLNDPITIDDPAGTGAGVVIQGRTQVAANVTIRTEAGNDNAAAPIDLSQAIVFADAAGRTLTLDASGGAFAGGDVTLGQFGNGGTGRYVRNLFIDGTGTPAGNLFLTDDVLLDDASGAPAAMTYAGGDVIVTDSLRVDTEQGNSAPGGLIDFGASRISASQIDKTLTLDALGAGSGGDIRFGSVGNVSGGEYLGGITLRTNATGQIAIQGDVRTDATSAITGAGVTIRGDVLIDLPANSVWTVDSEQGNDDDGRLIDLGDATFTAQNAATDVVLNSSGTSNAGEVKLGGFEPLFGGQRVRNLTITADGATNGDVTFTDLAQVDGAVAITQSKDIDVQQNVVTPTTMNFHADGVISGAGTLFANDLTLVAGQGIHGSTLALPLNVNTPLLAASSTVSGDVRILNHAAGAVVVTSLSAVGSGDVHYQQPGAGSLTVTGTVSTNSGDIVLDANGSIVLAGSSLLTTKGNSTQITVAAGGTLTLAPGGVIHVGTGAPNPGYVAHVPPLTTVTSPPPGGPNVDANGDTTIDIAIGNVAPVETGFEVSINWGDGPPQTISNVNGPTASVSHHYNANPNPNPLDPILVTVVVDMDPRIVLTENNGQTDLTSSSTNIALSVAGTFFAFGSVAPAAVAPPPRVVTPVFVAPVSAAPNIIVVATRTTDQRSVSMSVSPGQERKFLLRLVLPEDPDQPNQSDLENLLSDEELNDLSGLFRRLPDGRYQIWLVLEDGTRQLVRDFYVRDGKAIDLEDLGIEPGTPEPADEPVRRAPRAKPPADEQLDERSNDRGADTPSRGVQDPFDDSTDQRTERDDGAPAIAPPRTSSPRDSLDREARGDWSDRAREALANTDERAYSKARRLLRRGSV